MGVPEWLRPAEGAGEGPCGAWDVGENRVCPRSLFTKAVTVPRVPVETASPCKLDTSDPTIFATGRHQAKGVRRAVLEACWSVGGCPRAGQGAHDPLHGLLGAPRQLLGRRRPCVFHTCPTEARFIATAPSGISPLKCLRSRAVAAASGADVSPQHPG